MKEERLIEELRLKIQESTGRKCGLGDIPDNHGQVYTILDFTAATPGTGAWADPEEEREFIFSVTAVGGSVKQVSWMCRKVQEAITGRGPNGDYATPITGDGFTVTARMVNGFGAIVPSGKELRQRVDDYRIRAGV